MIDDFEHFEADKYMRSLGSANLVSDVEMKLLFWEDKSFRVVLTALFISLILLFFNYFLW